MGQEWIAGTLPGTIGVFLIVWEEGCLNQVVEGRPVSTEPCGGWHLLRDLIHQRG